MNNDIILCLNPSCNCTFKEHMPKYNEYKKQDWKEYDSRENPKRKLACPYCHGTNTINIQRAINKIKQQGMTAVLSSGALEKDFTHTQIELIRAVYRKMKTNII